MVPWRLSCIFIFILHFYKLASQQCCLGRKYLFAVVDRRMHVVTRMYLGDLTSEYITPLCISCHAKSHLRSQTCPSSTLPFTLHTHSHSWIYYFLLSASRHFRTGLASFVFLVSSKLSSFPQKALPPHPMTLFPPTGRYILFRGYTPATAHCFLGVVTGEN